MKKYFLGMLAGLSLTASVAMAENIHPITREMGSGTRGAFVEIFNITKEVRGKKIDAISTSAEVTNSTGVMIASIANSKSSIGYISLGSLKDNVKALSIDGVAPSVENINNKSYKIARNFNLVTKSTNPLMEDFLNYATTSKDIIQKAGYIATKEGNHKVSQIEGKLVIAGSSSITPLMEKLAEGYKGVNKKATIEILQSDSTTGVNSVVDGLADIGMVSRDVKQAELDKGIKVQVLAVDGLAIIVNKENKIDNISKEAVKKIFTGETKEWDKL
ncbi:phosphate ABC transporter substrate-binding protein [Helicobacter valdiviensis]|uniref:Phosphate ABC transporter substrate-binding protein n=1 Tax=Helicobacter valdiviensis TaxID=1458358 RepID=A0A2W6MVH2_9HELI|nr:substrate-binding domain-containing protein [Helicobacter valdiviensis]PZT48524.1 phosphate ABC transporter substrate-binding protein [Helicobacter valdiviensis]